jgi:hypothetical protein
VWQLHEIFNSSFFLDQCICKLYVFYRYAGYPINQKSCMTKPVPLCSLTNLQLRFLCPSDLEEVCSLLQAKCISFRINYVILMMISELVYIYGNDMLGSCLNWKRKEHTPFLWPGSVFGIAQKTGSRTRASYQYTGQFFNESLTCCVWSWFPCLYSFVFWNSITYRM